MRHLKRTAKELFNTYYLGFVASIFWKKNQFNIPNFMPHDKNELWMANMIGNRKHSRKYKLLPVRGLDKLLLLFLYCEVTEEITKGKIDRFGYIKTCKHMYNNKNKIT